MGQLGLEPQVWVPEVVAELELFSASAAVVEAPRVTKQTTQYRTDQWTKNNNRTKLISSINAK
jgi:hypothetical protein